ncbi:acetylxylan esterase [candidate division KSB1 bacterium]|nr:acetylxylan esterase [candidate division KSB1 bacterium]
MTLKNKSGIIPPVIVLFFVFCSNLLISSSLRAQNEDLSVISQWTMYTDCKNSLYRYLYSVAYQQLDLREQETAELTTKAKWQKRQSKVRKILTEIIGRFPDKSPLNARITGTVQKQGYRIEKIIYESLPSYYVTACLFLPDNLNGKAPAVIYCSGHTDLGFRSPVYQHVMLNLVQKGFIVFAFDPMGQGERLEYFDPAIGESRIGSSTLEHSYPGAQCFITGSSLAYYMIWDGIRAVDYLLTRPEVDGDRIGITGRSGGGTQSSYIAACDDRIYAAAPECYITSFKRLLESSGPQDAEQNFYHGIVNGIDHADLLEVRAPRPAMLIATSRDFFSIQGARETAAEVRNVYRLLGSPDNFSMSVDDAPHESTLKNREAMYAFFQKHLDLPGSPKDVDTDTLTAKELQVTETGQVGTSLTGESIYSLNRVRAQALDTNLNKTRTTGPGYPQSIIDNVRELSGYIPPDKNINAVFTGRFQWEGYTVEKFFIRGDSNYVIPFILLKPDQDGKHPAVIYIHPQGKAANIGPGSEMEWFVKKGYIVLAPDVLGIGETGPGDFIGDAYAFKVGKASYNIWFLGILTQRNLVAIRAGDIIKTVNYLKSRDDVIPEQIKAVARGDMCPSLLHAAVFDSSITDVALIEPLVSYRSIVQNEYYQPGLIPSTVAGALTAYDLPDLAACIAPRKLLMVNVVDHNRKPAPQILVDQELNVVYKTYAKKGQQQNLTILAQDYSSHPDLKDVLLSWLK